MLLIGWTLCYLAIATALPAKHQEHIARFLVKPDRNDGRLITRQPEVCMTEYCTDVANSILKNRDTSVDPCVDFYQYACGYWESNNPIPKTEVAWSQDDKITEKTYLRIKDALEDHREDDIEPIRMVKKFYQTCMDVDAIEKRGIEPLLDILNKTGGWPIVDPNWQEDNVPWQEIDLYYMSTIGNGAFYNIEYERDERNTSRNILTIDQDVQHPLSGKKKEWTLIYDFNDTYMNGIEKVVQVFADAYGYELDERQMTRDIVDIVLFELEIENIIEEEKQNGTLGREFTITTIKELQYFYDMESFTPTAKIDFVKVIKHIFQMANVEVDDSEPILLYNEICLYKLAKLLNRTPPRVIVNYIQWNMLHGFLYHTTQELADIKFEMYFAKYNITEKPPRWKFCLSVIQMKEALSYLFVKNYSSEQVKEAATNMLNSMQEELKDRILRSDWIKDDVKDFMKEKLQNIVKQIGYPEKYKNDSYLIERYRGLEIGDDFFENVLKCDKYDTIKIIQEIKQPIDRTEWLDYPMTVNAFYSEDTNTIIIPAAELQDPYFTESLPDAVNYGAVGFVIGHELSHAFDNDGIEHDKLGNKVSWASDQILDEYNKRATCFIRQFSNYSLMSMDDEKGPISLDGNLTEDENIADSMGIQVAFAAYSKARKKRPQLKLPGLENLPDDKLFFLSFANSWCSASNPQYEVDSANDDEHSPSKFRVLGSLSNMESFSRIFQCPPGSPMNPETKCSLWK